MYCFIFKDYDRQRSLLSKNTRLLHGITHPTHYHAVYDELNSKLDGVQELLHALSYVFICAVAPIRYAQLNATQMSWFIIPATEVSDAQLPRHHPRINKILFFY
ncbi:hypothetical protein Pfo_005407 [Paulownia fortunei]|nr:hypothetical protein Pfo_005407 [Paulownia fortunei]